MNRIACCIIAVLLAGCIKSPTHQLEARWDFINTDMPMFNSNMERIAGADNEEVSTTYRKFFIDSKLILRRNGSFDLVLFRDYTHGKWQYDNNNKEIALTEMNVAGKITLHVDSLSTGFLQVKMDSAAINKLVTIKSAGEEFIAFMQNEEYVLQLAVNREKYRNADTDPYSKQNNLWRIRPTISETASQIKQRVQNHLDFWKLLFTDAVQKDKEYISFSWFASPLVIAADGVALRKYERISKEWVPYFFDSTQAKTGYHYLQQCFSRQLTPGKSESRFENDLYMINQLIKNMQ